MISDYIEESYTELEARVHDMESDMDALVSDYLANFYVDDTFIKNTSNNYSLANKSNEVFDDAFNAFIIGFLLFLAKKITNGTILTVSDFSAKGIKPVGDEVAKVGKMIGYVDGKIVKGGYLSELGKMGILRLKFHNYIIKGVSTGQKLNLFLKGARPMFRSFGEDESDFAAFYRRYAYDSVAQTMNTIALYIADERGLTHFLYEGGLVKDSRPFCRTQAGGTFTRDDAKKFDAMDWKGKIPDVPFLIAAGGYNCQHFINWIPNK